jgi:hypothetical protein
LISFFCSFVEIKVFKPDAKEWVAGLIYENLDKGEAVYQKWAFCPSNVDCGKPSLRYSPLHADHARSCWSALNFQRWL